MGLFETCEWRWKIEQLQKQRQPVYGENLLFGTVVHETIEKYLSRKPEIASLEGAKEFLTKRMTEQLTEEREHMPDADLEKMIASGHLIMDNIGKCKELNEMAVVSNELELMEPITRDDGLDIKFKGFIDIVLSGKDARGKQILYIADFKTSARGWNKDKRRDVSLQRQLFLYKHFFCKKMDLDPKLVRTAFIILKKNAWKKNDDNIVEFLKVSAGPVVVERAIRHLETTIDRMVSGRYKKNRSECKNKWGDTCPHLGTDRCRDDDSDLVELIVKKRVRSVDAKNDDIVSFGPSVDPERSGQPSEVSDRGSSQDR